MSSPGNRSPLLSRQRKSSSPASPVVSKRASQKLIKGYQLGDVIGRGQFGKVYRGLHVGGDGGAAGGGGMVAIKEIRKDAASQAGESLTRELQVMKSLEHPNLVKLVDFHETTTYLYFILEFVSGGSLHETVKRFGPLPEEVLKIYVQQILHGLKHLHANEIIHRDIKGANILLTLNGVCKVADFGSCTFSALNKKMTVVGSPFWMAPEIAGRSETAGTPADIWSLGCTIIELLTGSPPYWELGKNVALFRMTDDECPPLPEDIGDDCLDFLIQCFTRVPVDRPSASELSRHVWLQRKGEDTKLLEKYTSVYRMNEKQKSIGDSQLNLQAMFDRSNQSSTPASDYLHIATPHPGVSSSVPISPRQSNNNTATPNNRATAGINAKIDKEARSPDRKSVV
eukprot:TRINITY_DN883_c0_g1_i7.p1 TRINITY_DN883_c0_g1~~TRINITY_DN883_c0_g1_i7.p1  ORF type:complete len:398 (-),score=62.75 TRINITY_DN883_c0_g1_i7:64-1257(-)